LKRRFTTTPILKHFDPDLPSRLHTDASGFAISGIVSQLHDPHCHPVAFYSRKCTPTKCNYDIHDRELLAIVESMRHWRHYLEGSCNPVQVLSDYENLKIFMSPNRRQARWAELLANYDLVLIPIPIPTGSLIPPKALRLLPSNFTNSTVNTLFASLVGVDAVEAVAPTLQERIISSYPTDAHSRSCSKDSLLLCKDLIYIPESSSSLRMDILRERHDAPLAGHPGIARTIELITRNYWFPSTLSPKTTLTPAIRANKERHRDIYVTANWLHFLSLIPLGRVYPATLSWTCLFQTARTRSSCLLIE